jgi:malate dehydrogenase (oxaloacetate-decarboxylating)(NADP+)
VSLVSLHDVRTESPLSAKAPAVPGLIPPAFSLKVQLDRTLLQLRSKSSPIEKYSFLAQLKEVDAEAFYRLCLENMSVWLFSCQTF